MHEPVQGKIEALLQGDQPANSDTDSTLESSSAHLRNCEECRTELESMRRQAEQFRSLLPEVSEAPDPGFYARVLQRIGEQETDSIWLFLANSVFSRRLAYISLSLAIALGSYVAVQESREDSAVQSFQTISDSGIWHYENSSLRYDNPVIGSPDEQRTAVLIHFSDNRGIAQ